MNAITPASGNAVAALQSLRQGLQNVSQTIIVAGGDPFLKLKNGRWMYGAENVEVEPGSQWAINPLSLKHGFVSWTDHPGKQANEIVGEVMVPMTSPLPDRLALPDTGWDWAQQLSWQIKCLTGEDAGEQTLYKITSVGGLTAMDKVISAIMQQLDNDPTRPVPVITLDVDSYPHKKWGETFVPIFTIVKWVSMDGTEADAAAEPELPLTQTPSAAEPTKRRRRTKAEIEAAKAAEAAQTAGNLDQAEPSDYDIDELERLIAERKAAKAAAAAQASTPQVDEKAARREALLKQMAELDADNQEASPLPDEQATEAGQVVRRRRQ